MYFCVPDGSVDNFSSKFTSTIQVAAVIQPGFNSEAAQSQHELFPAPSHQTLDKFTTNQFISAGKRCLAKTRVRHACACPICTYTHTQKEYKSAIFSVLYNVGEKVWNGRRLGHGLFFFLNTATAEMQWAAALKWKQQSEVWMRIDLWIALLSLIGRII
jgi:hypothetical protein